MRIIIIIRPKPVILIAFSKPTRFAVFRRIEPEIRGAFIKCPFADRCIAAENGHVSKSRAALKSPIFDTVNTGGNCDSGQSLTILKRRPTDSTDAIREGNAFHFSAAIKR